MIHYGVLGTDINLDNLKDSDFELIKCPKYSQDALGVCAVTAGSFFDKESWTIFFGGN
jgi:hypothetical protein